MPAVTIFHNVDRDSFLGYQPGHPLVPVFTYTAPDSSEDGKILGAAFEMFNIGTGPVSQAYRARHLRSLSMGDAAQVDDRLYAVASASFEPIPRDEARVLTGAEAETAIRERHEIPAREELSVTVPLPDQAD